jgi:pimeloyl-ACP methyl ester carboxylesterase
MKRFLRTVGFMFGFLLIALVILAVIFHHPDLDLESLKSKYTTPQSQFVEVEGMQMHYSIRGSGPNLLLLHGTGGSLHDWNPWVAELENDFRIITPDLPAFGLTGPNPEDDYSLEMYLRTMETFLDKIGIDSCYLAGNSFGGFIAWNYALEHPETVKKLILLDASGYPRKLSDMPLAFRLAGNPKLSRFVEKLTPRALIRRTALEVFEDDSQVSKERVDRYFDLLRRPGNRRGVIGRMQQIQYDGYGRIPEISQPTLILWGDKDKLVAVENARRFDADIPVSELIMYENVGHVPMEEIPERSAKDAKRFLLGE